MKNKKVVALKTEEKEYCGIRYKLILVGLEGERFNNPGEKNENLWWNIEFYKEDVNFVKTTFKNFLWFDTRGMVKYRLMDKHNQCELVAMKMIEELLSGHFLSRLKWIFKTFFKEIKFMLICERHIFLKRIKFLFRKK